MHFFRSRSAPKLNKGSIWNSKPAFCLELEGMSGMKCLSFPRRGSSFEVILLLRSKAKQIFAFDTTKDFLSGLLSWAPQATG